MSPATAVLQPVSTWRDGLTDNDSRSTALLHLSFGEDGRGLTPP